MHYVNPSFDSIDEDNYQLAEASSARDKGISHSTLGSPNGSFPKYDFNLNLRDAYRAVGGASDIGCYEYAEY